MCRTAFKSRFPYLHVLRLEITNFEAQLSGKEEGEGSTPLKETKTKNKQDSLGSTCCCDQLSHLRWKEEEQHQAKKV